MVSMEKPRIKGFQRQQTCRFFMENGFCKYGSDCRYSHPGTPHQGRPAGWRGAASREEGGRRRREPPRDWERGHQGRVDRRGEMCPLYLQHGGVCPLKEKCPFGHPPVVGIGLTAREEHTQSQQQRQLQHNQVTLQLEHLREQELQLQRQLQIQLSGQPQPLPQSNPPANSGLPPQDIGPGEGMGFPVFNYVESPGPGNVKYCPTKRKTPEEPTPSAPQPAPPPPPPLQALPTVGDILAGAVGTSPAPPPMPPPSGHPLPQAQPHPCPQGEATPPVVVAQVVGPAATTGLVKPPSSSPPPQHPHANPTQATRQLPPSSSDPIKVPEQYSPSRPEPQPPATPDHEPEEYSPSSPSLGRQFLEQMAKQQQQQQQQKVQEEELRQNTQHEHLDPAAQEQPLNGIQVLNQNQLQRKPISESQIQSVVIQSSKIEENPSQPWQQTPPDQNQATEYFRDGPISSVNKQVKQIQHTGEDEQLLDPSRGDGLHAEYQQWQSEYNTEEPHWQSTPSQEYMEQKGDQKQLTQHVHPRGRGTHRDWHESQRADNFHGRKHYRSDNFEQRMKEPHNELQRRPYSEPVQTGREKFEGPPLEREKLRRSGQGGSWAEKEECNNVSDFGTDRQSMHREWEEQRRQFQHDRPPLNEPWQEHQRGLDQHRDQDWHNHQRGTSEDGLSRSQVWEKQPREFDAESNFGEERAQRQQEEGCWQLQQQQPPAEDPGHHQRVSHGEEWQAKTEHYEAGMPVHRQELGPPAAATLSCWDAPLPVNQNFLPRDNPPSPLPPSPSSPLPEEVEAEIARERPACPIPQDPAQPPPIKAEAKEGKQVQALDAMFANFLSEIDESSSKSSRAETPPTKAHKFTSRPMMHDHKGTSTPVSCREDVKQSQPPTPTEHLSQLSSVHSTMESDHDQRLMVKKKHSASVKAKVGAAKVSSATKQLEIENKALAERNKELKLIIDHLEKNMKSEQKRKARASNEFWKEKNKDLQLIIDHLEKDLKVKDERCASLESEASAMKEKLLRGKRELKDTHKSLKNEIEKKKVNESRMQRLMGKIEKLEQELSEALEKSKKTIEEAAKKKAKIKEEEQSPLADLSADQQKLMEEVAFYKAQAEEAVDTAQQISMEKDAAIFGLEMQLGRQHLTHQSQGVVLKGAVIIDQTRIKKQFESYGECEGTVVGFENQQFYIQYDDGDTETLFYEELMKWAQPDTLGQPDSEEGAPHAQARLEALKEEVDFWKQRAFSAKNEANTHAGSTQSQRYLLTARLEHLKASHKKREENLMQRKETERISLEKYYSAKTETVEEQKKQVEQEKEDLQKEKEELELKVQTSEKALKEKEDQAQTLETKLLELKQQLEAKDEEIIKYQSGAEDLKAKIQSLKVELEEKESELEKQAEVAAQVTESTLSKHEDLAGELQKCQNDLRRQRKAAEDLKKQMRGKDTELRALRKKAARVPSLEEDLDLAHKKHKEMEYEQASALAELRHQLAEEQRAHDIKLTDTLSKHLAEMEALHERIGGMKASHEAEVEGLRQELTAERVRADQAQSIIPPKQDEAEMLGFSGLLNLSPDGAERLGLRWELLHVFRKNLCAMWEELERHRKALRKLNKRFELPSREEISQKIEFVRENVAHDVFMASSFFQRELDAKGVFLPLFITFIGSGGIFGSHQEDGLDDGGLTNEFFTLFFEQLEDVELLLKGDSFRGKGKTGEVRLFERMSKESLIVLPQKFCDDNGKPYELTGALKKKYFTFGRMLLRSLLHDKTVPSRFASSLMMDYCLGYERRRSKKPYHQIRKELIDIDPEYQWVLTHLDGVEASPSVELTFGDILFVNDSRRIHDQTSAKECLNEFIYQQIIRPRQQQLNCIKNGFGSQEEINFTPFLEVCSYQEMQLLISGYEEFDAEAILNCLVFSNFLPEEDFIIEYFKGVVREMSGQQLQGFLRFATGLSALPAAGDFHIHVAPLCDDQDTGGEGKGLGGRKTQGYPISHTCVKEVEIPIYSSQDELQQRLFEAISPENCRFTTT